MIQFVLYTSGRQKHILSDVQSIAVIVWNKRYPDNNRDDLARQLFQVGRRTKHSWIFGHVTFLRCLKELFKLADATSSGQLGIKAAMDKQW